jgi:hypothetical protein
MQLMEALTRNAHELLTPAHLTARQLDQWYGEFNRAHAGQRILLGDFIQMQAGVCSQQALLVKVLADSMGGHTVGGGAHAWVELTHGGQVYVFDPRNQVFGAPASRVRDVFRRDN